MSVNKVTQRPDDDTVVVADTSDTCALAARGRGRTRRRDVAVKAASEQSGVTADSTPFPGLSERRRRPARSNRTRSPGKLHVDADRWSNAGRTDEARPEAKQCRPDCQPPLMSIGAFAVTGGHAPRSESPGRLAGQSTALTTPDRPSFVLYEGDLERHSQTCTLQNLTRSRLYTQRTLDCNVLAVNQHGIQEADQGMMPAEDDRPEFAHLQPMLTSLPSVLTEKQRLQAREVIFKNANVFSRNEFDLGRTHLMEHRIYTGDAAPVAEPLRRHAQVHEEFLENHIQNLLKANIIEPAASPWASNIVVVNRPGKTPRFTVDLRNLNGVTYKDKYPIPRIQDCLDALGGNMYFSTLDQTSSFHQIPIDSRDRDKIAFLTKSGQYRYQVMPMGAANSPSAFSRLMNLILRGLVWHTCLIYIDDTIVVSRSFDEHVKRLDDVLQRFHAAHLKLKP